MEESRKTLSNLVFKRLLRKGGVLRTRTEVNDLLATITQDFLAKILRACIIVVTQGKKTMRPEHLEIACRTMGINMAVGVSPTATVTPSLVTGSTYPRRKAASGEKPKRKFKQGTVSTREVKFQQSRDKLVFRKAAFAKYCKWLILESGEIKVYAKEINLQSLNCSKVLFAQLQVLCERYIIALAASAWSLAVASNQKTLNAGHISSVIKINEKCRAFYAVR